MADEHLEGEVARLRQEVEALRSPPSRKSGNGCGVVVAVVVGAGLLLMMAGAVFGGRDGGSPDIAATAPPAVCNKAWADQVVTTAERSPLIRDMDVTKAEGVVVVVGRPQWEFLNTADHKVIAAAIDCAISGPGKHLSEIHFRYNRSGEDQLSLSAIDLLRLREAGYAKGPD